MGFKTCRVSQKARFKRRVSASGCPGTSGLKVPLDMNKKWVDLTDHRNFSPKAAPFNSTSFLIRKNRRHLEEVGAPRTLEQYGSNMGSITTCRPFAHNRSCYYQSPAQHPIDCGMLNHDSREEVSPLCLQFQELQVTEFGSAMEIDDAGGSHEPGHSAPKHWRVRSFTDDNFDMLYESNVGCS